MNIYIVNKFLYSYFKLHNCFPVGSGVSSTCFEVERILLYACGKCLVVGIIVVVYDDFYPKHLLCPSFVHKNKFFTHKNPLILSF